MFNLNRESYVVFNFYFINDFNRLFLESNKVNRNSLEYFRYLLSIEKHGRSGLWFQIAMILSVGILLPEWLEVTEGENYQCCAFLACIGLIFVGSAPCFKLELDGKVHIGATIVCGLASLLYMIFAGYTTIPLLLAFPTGF